MITAIGLALDNHSSGNQAAAQQVLDTLDTGARWQVDLRFSEVEAICVHRVTVEQEPRNGNRMAIETWPVMPRCMRQSPDGRGAAWILSGGSPLVYGRCCLSECPIGR